MFSLDHFFLDKYYCKVTFGLKIIIKMSKLLFEKKYYMYPKIISVLIKKKIFILSIKILIEYVISFIN